MERSGYLVAGEFAAGIGSGLDQPEEHGVVGHRVKVQRLAQLHLESAGVGQGLTLGIAVGVVRGIGDAEYIGIEGVGRVYMQVAKVGIALRVGPGPQFQNLAIGGQRCIAIPGSTSQAHRLVGLCFLWCFTRGAGTEQKSTKAKMEAGQGIVHACKLPLGGRLVPIAKVGPGADHQIGEYSKAFIGGELFSNQ